MMGSWTFFNPVEIHFGRGSISCLASFEAGRCLAIMTDGARRRGAVDWLRRSGAGDGLTVHSGLTSNPLLEDLESAIARLRCGKRFDSIIAVGGGSTLDFAKVVSVGLGAGEEWSLRDHLLGKTTYPTCPPVPVVAIPTTAGTGSEVTPFATIWDKEAGVKRSLSHRSMFPRVAILDPNLLAGTPREVAVYCGLDALAQALDSWWNRGATELTKGWSKASMALALDALPAFAGSPHDPVAAGRMMQASLLAGLAISQTRTAMSHAMSYPITLKFGVPHGLACGFTLGALWAHVYDKAPGTLEEIACSLGWNSAASGEEHLALFLKGLGVKEALCDYGVDLDALIGLVPSMFPPERAGNQWPSCSEADVRAILRRSLA